jgi:acetylornithine deacetylase
LQQLIAVPSFSKEEQGTADLIVNFLQSKGVTVNRHLQNVWAVNRHFDPAKPTLLLNSHHDTVKPNKGYTKDPFTPQIENGRLYGLGSNDAGGPLVALIATFLYFSDRTTYRIIYCWPQRQKKRSPEKMALKPCFPCFHQ